MRDVRGRKSWIPASESQGLVILFWVTAAVLLWNSEVDRDAAAFGRQRCQLFANPKSGKEGGSKMLTRMLVPALAVALFAGVRVQGKPELPDRSPFLTAFGYADEGIVPNGWVPIEVTDALLLAVWPDAECAWCRERLRLAGEGFRRAGRVSGC